MTIRSSWRLILGGVTTLGLVVILGLAVGRVLQERGVLPRPKAANEACQSGGIANGLIVYKTSPNNPTFYWGWPTGQSPKGAAQTASVYIWDCNPNVSSCLAKPAIIGQVATAPVTVADFGLAEIDTSVPHWWLVQGDSCKPGCCATQQVKAGYRCLPRCGNKEAYVCATPAEAAASNGCFASRKLSLSVAAPHGKITCNGQTCPATFIPGTAVKLQVTSDAGYSFKSWTGNCDDETGPECLLTMDTAKVVLANFNQASPSASRTLTINPPENGTITGGGINCGLVEGPLICTKDLADGAAVTLTATPAANYSFSGWSGACNGSNPVCKLTMDANETVGATFTLLAPTPVDGHWGGSSGFIKNLSESSMTVSGGGTTVSSFYFEVPAAPCTNTYGRYAGFGQTVSISNGSFVFNPKGSLKFSGSGTFTSSTSATIKLEVPSQSIRCSAAGGPTVSADIPSLFAEYELNNW